MISRLLRSGAPRRLRGGVRAVRGSGREQRGSPAGVGDVDLLPGPGDVGGEILAGERGHVAGEIGVGQEGVVPDQGLEIAAQGVVLLEDVERDAARARSGP